MRSSVVWGDPNGGWKTTATNNNKHNNNNRRVNRGDGVCKTAANSLNSISNNNSRITTTIISNININPWAVRAKEDSAVSLEEHGPFVKFVVSMAVKEASA